jgi:alpha/beta superfamily hydrolase
LEVLVSFPKQVPDVAIPYGVVCHPHPLYGGTMENKVVYMITSTFNALGAGIIRFNFRGVGGSDGEFDQGVGEVEDLRAVVDWTRDTYSPKELWLAGFSFGAYIALRSHRQMNAQRLLLVAPALEGVDPALLELHSTVETLVIQGGRDDVVSPKIVFDWVGKQNPQPRFQWINAADHFFHGQLSKLREVITYAWK